MADPVGVSGLIIGLPGLVTACADLYKLTVAARNLDSDVQMVVCKAVIQQWKFASWLKDVGFEEGVKPKIKLTPQVQVSFRLVLGGIETTLSQLCDLIDEYALPMDPEKKAEQPLPSPLWRLRFSAPSQDTSTSQHRSLLDRIARKTTKAPKWAAAQQERADKLLKDLQELCDGLLVLTGQTANATGDTVLPSRMLPHIWEDNKLQTFIEAATAYEPELAICAQFKRDVLAAAKAVEAAGARPKSGPGRAPLRMLPARISKRRSADSSRMIAAELEDKSTGQMERVLLEDKSYAGRSSDYESFVEKRVTELAMILTKSPKPARMRVLDCAGYVPNRKDESFSLIFRFPKNADSGTDPISLQHLLPPGINGWAQRHSKVAAGAAGESPHNTVPSLQVRFQMGTSLTHSFSLLQACGMLHKGLSPANIIFFKTATSGSSPEGESFRLSEPYISGFTWARLHGADFHSDPVPANDMSSRSGLLHVHPAYSFTTEQRYLKLFDLYSLGLVLMQIGLWRSLEDIADELFLSPKSAVNLVGAKLDEATNAGGADEWVKDSVSKWQDELVKHQKAVAQSDGIALQGNPREAFQRALVDNVERMLLPVVGDIYAKVVKRCLTGDIEHDSMPSHIVEPKPDEEISDQILQDAIARNAVEELEKCNA
ncbi:hypothetical protein QBC47DRAFT_373141 [Echria macrotheca]|uniref:Prion-inhibition and propagation HeLo domain-containing protein n=1 Tax=Echria macrotheca TaxID=438768 RepID=A0AAJ0BMB0_9PEZI|nr:hypothetical protein QBC47DRAFT_373141 [Echria macrotheca]